MQLSDYKHYHCYLWPISVITVPQSLIPVVTHISGGAEQKTHRIIQTMQKLGHKD